MSHLIAEKLSKLKVKLNKNNETRWNSIISYDRLSAKIKTKPNQRNSR